MRGRSGFTLLELMVVGLIGTIVVVFIANATRWYARSANAIHVESQLDKELRMAGQALADDFGRSLAARTTDGDDIQFDIDNGDATAQWAAPDTVIEYVLQDSLLIRKDLSAGTQVPMARNVRDFQAFIDDGHLSVTCTTGYRDTEQKITFQLRDP